MATDGRLDNFTFKQKHSQVGQLFRIKSRGNRRSVCFSMCAQRDDAVQDQRNEVQDQTKREVKGNQ